MKNKKLVILSGAGDPENEKYKKVYDLIIHYAKTLCYSEIIIHGWKGQDSYSEKGFLNMTDATVSAISFFEKLEKDNVRYDVICRSFGTGVFLNLCQTVELKNIGFSSLWGLPMYTAFYELFKENMETTIISSRKKGVNVENSFFHSVIPFELLLSRFKQSFRLNIVNGTEDIYSTPDFYNFLVRSIKCKNISFSLIEGLPHEVTEYHQEYLEKLFGITK